MRPARRGCRTKRTSYTTNTLSPAAVSGENLHQVWRADCLGHYFCGWASYSDKHPEVDKTWFERVEREDKIVLNKCETLNSTVEGLGREVINLKEREGGSAASTVATSSGYQEFKLGLCLLGIELVESGITHEVQKDLACSIF